MKKKPKTGTLFLAIAGEAEACMRRTDWDRRLNNIQNIVTVIRSRMNCHWQRWHESELEKLIEKSRKARGDK